MRLRKVAKIYRRLYGEEGGGATFYPHHTNVSKVGKNREIRSLFFYGHLGKVLSLERIFKKKN